MRHTQEVVERLLLDRINAEAGRAAVGGPHPPAVAPGTNEAEAALPLMELAVARTEIALNPAVRERMPEARLKTFLDGAHLIHINIDLIFRLNRQPKTEAIKGASVPGTLRRTIPKPWTFRRFRSF